VRAFVEGKLEVLKHLLAVCTIGAVPQPGDPGRRIGLAMVDVAAQGTGKHGGLVFENRDIRAMSRFMLTIEGLLRR
jgi:hypothetical protein